MMPSDPMPMRELLNQRNTWDHELSLLSALTFLILLGYVCFVALSFLLSLFSRGKIRPIPFKSNILYSLIVLYFFTEVPWQERDGLADWIQGNDPKLNDLVRQIPRLRQGPSPPLILRNRHLQFIPFLIQNEIHRRQRIPYERMNVPVGDCPDKVQGCKEKSMLDTITLDVFPPYREKIPQYGKGFSQSSPVIFFIPGLRCDSQDLPGNAIVRKAWAEGFRSIVVNRRGHTPGQPLSSPRWNLFGDVEDMEQVYWYVKEHLATSHTPFFLHGISSGTALTVTGLSQWDKRRAMDPTSKVPVFVGSMSVTPGYDISKVLNRQRFLWPYNDVLLGGVKDYFVKQNEALLRKFDNEAVDGVLAATSLQEVVDAAVTFAGYRNTTQYYEQTNPVNDLQDITTPKLVLNAIDDPCCNIKNLYEVSPYPQHGGKAFDQFVRESERAMIAVTWTGSHIPFLCGRDRWLPFTKDPLTGGSMLHSWADQVSIDFYKASLNIFGDRRYLTNAVVPPILTDEHKGVWKVT